MNCRSKIKFRNIWLFRKEFANEFGFDRYCCLLNALQCATVLSNWLPLFIDFRVVALYTAQEDEASRKVRANAPGSNQW